MSDLDLSSPVFDDGDRIPEVYGYTERNVNPPLHIDGVPDAAESLAIVMDDPDAVEPAGKIWDHWVVRNVPADVEEIPEGWDADAAGAVEGQNDFGEVGYGGPNPPDREHTYRFVVYALDATLDVQRGAGKEAFQDAATGHSWTTPNSRGPTHPSGGRRRRTSRGARRRVRR